MKLNSRHRFMFLGVLAIVAAWTGLVHGDDLPATTSKADDASQVQAPVPNSAGTPPAAPNYESETSREESAASASSSNTPNMIGDLGPTLHLMVRLESTNFKFFNLPLPSPSASVLGAQRFADNDCTFPTDRVFCDYSYFHDAQLATPSDANRFVPGFEKTFLDGRMSVEMRFPVGELESSDILNANNPPYGMTGQFGDIQLIVKALLVREDTWALGAGMDVSIPTAPGLTVGVAGNPQFLQISNNSTHLLPYVGLLVTPNDDWFAQAFVQLDIAANGNSVSANPFGNGITSVGNLYDQTLVFVDATVGRWLYRNPSQRFSGLAAVVEAHYTGGLNAPSAIRADGLTIGYSTASYNVLDITVGAHAVIGNTTVTAGFATPVTEDRGFDGEIRLFVNRMF